MIPAEKKIRIVLSVAGWRDLGVAEAASGGVRAGDQGWSAQFLRGEDGGWRRTGRSRRPGAADEVAEDHPGEAAVEIRVWKKSRPVGPFEDAEVIRTEAGMPTARFT